MQIIRYGASSGVAGLGLVSEGQLIGHFTSEYSAIHDLLRLPAGALRARIDNIALDSSANRPETAVATILAPIDGDCEVWAAGVTYKRSEEARREESATPDIYAKVYASERPELFFKSLPRRLSGPGAPIAIRSDSTWDVPEPELVVVVNAHAEIVGYTIGNDVSSRSIEGENPLYLPQAKVYAGSCSLGPGITPVWEIDDPYNLTIQMRIERDGKQYWEGQTSTRELKRRLDELVEYLFREDDFPGGVFLCTGTALVPEHPFTLLSGDVVEIMIDRLGTLRNPVVRGKKDFATALLSQLQR